MIAYETQGLKKQSHKTSHQNITTQALRYIRVTLFFQLNLGIFQTISIQHKSILELASAKNNLKYPYITWTKMPELTNSISEGQPAANSSATDVHSLKTAPSTSTVTKVVSSTATLSTPETSKATTSLTSVLVKDETWLSPKWIPDFFLTKKIFKK